jgi:hypothetical protein
MAVLTVRDIAKMQASPVPVAGEASVQERAPRRDVNVSLKNVQNPEPKERYALMHPDAADDSPMFDCELTVPIPGEEPILVTMKRGRLETYNRKVCDSLVRMGYRWMNQPF